MFYKFTQSHDISNFTPGDEIVKWTKTVNGEEYGSFYYEINNQNVLNKAFSFVPVNLRDQFDASYMKINHSIPPHIDNEIITVINFYIYPSGCTTTFFETPDNLNPSETLENHTNGGLYDRDALTIHDQFQALYGDVFALDVSKIHEVTGPEPVNRIAICLQSASVSLEDLVAAI